MSTEPPTPNAVGQNQQASSRLINILTITIPLLSVIATGLITLFQKRMEIQMPIQATQAAEASRPLIVISTSTIQPITPSANTQQSETVASSSSVESVDVILNNPNTDAPSVHLIIKQDDAVIANLILPPGGTVPKIELPPGSYQVEARPIYPAITPRSAGCEIRWQLGESYTRDLVITSGEAMIQIQQFDLQPQEICPTGTLVPRTSTPSP